MVIERRKAHEMREFEDRLLRMICIDQMSHKEIAYDIGSTRNSVNGMVVQIRKRRKVRTTERLCYELDREIET